MLQQLLQPNNAAPTVKDAGAAKPAPSGNEQLVPMLQALGVIPKTESAEPAKPAQPTVPAANGMSNALLPLLLMSGQNAESSPMKQLLPLLLMSGTPASESVGDAQAKSPNGVLSQYSDLEKVLLLSSIISKDNNDYNTSISQQQNSGGADKHKDNSPNLLHLLGIGGPASPDTPGAPITPEKLATMSADEINANWDAVQKMLPQLNGDASATPNA